MDKLSQILKKAEIERNKLNHPYVGTEHLLLAILSQDNDLTTELKNYNLTYNKFKKKLISIVGIGTKPSEYVLYTPMLRSVLSSAEKSSLENNQEIDDKILFQSILDEGEGIAIRVIKSMKIDIKNINIDAQTNFLKPADAVITHRDAELSEICQILMHKNKSNPLLIGDAGVGKTAIVEELARRLKENL